MLLIFGVVFWICVGGVDVILVRVVEVLILINLFDMLRVNFWGC